MFSEKLSQELGTVIFIFACVGGVKRMSGS